MRSFSHGDVFMMMTVIKLKYCGLGRYNSTVVVSYYWKHAR